MIKILYVITKSNFGGAQRYVYELATKLSKDFTSEVALGGDGKLKTMLLEAGVSVHSINEAARDIDIFKEFKVLLNLYQIFRKVRPDIVHLNSSKIGGLGAIAARLAGVEKIIFTCHGWAFKEPRPLWQNTIIKFISWITIILCDTTIVLSQRELEYVSLWPLASKRLQIIPNGVSHFELLTRNEALINLVGLEIFTKIQEKKIRVVGTIAELHKNKGLTYAIKGMSLLNDPRTIFIVIGEGEDRAQLEKEILDTDLKESVFLVGNIDNARTYLKAFDFFILPSLKEGLPYTVLEAGYAGLPVIATNVGGIPEIITNLESGLLISPRRPQEIKHALIYVENHAEDIARFAETLNKKVTEFYSLEKMITSTETLYSK